MTGSSSWANAEGRPVNAEVPSAWVDAEATAGDRIPTISRLAARAAPVSCARVMMLSPSPGIRDEFRCWGEGMPGWVGVARLCAQPAKRLILQLLRIALTRV